MTLVPYSSITIKENNEPLVDLETLDLKVEPKYFQAGLSETQKMFLREGVAQKLLNVQKKLKGLKFKIWDGFRPRKVQDNIYQKYWSELKTAHPEWDDETLRLKVGAFVSPGYQKDRIPPHATGGTVDLTLIDANGKELDMGTEFDCFEAKAAAFFYEIYRNYPEIQKNKQILREAMLTENFTLDEEEWWHFDYGNQTWALKMGADFASYGEIESNMNE